MEEVATEEATTEVTIGSRLMGKLCNELTDALSKSMKRHAEEILADTADPGAVPSMTLAICLAMQCKGLNINEERAVDLFRQAIKMAELMATKYGEIYYEAVDISKE